jgi:hypothetical protein
MEKDIIYAFRVSKSVFSGVIFWVGKDSKLHHDTSGFKKARRLTLLSGGVGVYRG